MGRIAQPDPVLGAVLRELRERKGLTREATAFRAGLRMGTIGQIERGLTTPAFATVRRLARALGMTLVELAVAIEAAEGTPADAGLGNQG
jgi:transcriptional regulator with XRE-family HTH domain